MKTVCIDTHALIWYVTKPVKLGRAAAKVLRGVDQDKTAVLIPAVAAIELTLLREAGRRVIGIRELAALLSGQPAFSLLAMDRAQTEEFAFLDSLEDPFDRMVVAAARASKVPLITADRMIEDSALVEVLWD